MKHDEPDEEEQEVLDDNDAHLGADVSEHYLERFDACERQEWSSSLECANWEGKRMLISG